MWRRRYARDIIPGKRRSGERRPDSTLVATARLNRSNPHVSDASAGVGSIPVRLTTQLPNLFNHLRGPKDLPKTGIESRCHEPTLQT